METLKQFFGVNILLTTCGIIYRNVAALTAVIILLVTGSFKTAAAPTAQLKAGVAKINITNLASGGVVKDSLYARVLLLDNGSIVAVIISVDDVGVGLFLDSVRLQLQKDLRISPSNVLINASHLHTRRTMCRDIDKRIVSAVKIAWNNRVPVTAGAGSGYEERIMENRRLKLKDGREATIRHANPLPPDSDVAGIGPVDPEIGILRLDRRDGKPLAVVYNFACHPYQDSWRSLSNGTTADFPGYASRVIENNLGENSVAMFLQGCGGDVTTVLYKDVDNPRDAEPLGNMLGISTLDALNNIRSGKNTELKLIHEIIELPKRTDIPGRLASLNAEQEELVKSLRGTSLNLKTFIPLYIKYTLSPDYPSYYSHRYMREKATGKSDLEGLDAENRMNIDKYLRNIIAMERLARNRENMVVLEEQQKILDEVGNKPLNIEVTGIRIGDFVLVTFPGEAVVEIGLDIKKMSPHKHTFIAAYTNENGFAGYKPMVEGNVNYAPSTEQFKGEDYEDACTFLAPEWQKIYEDKVLEILKKL
jgi:hypothetical protein